MKSKRDLDKRKQKLRQIQSNLQSSGVSRQDLRIVIEELINVMTMTYEDRIDSEERERRA